MVQCGCWRMLCTPLSLRVALSAGTPAGGKRGKAPHKAQHFLSLYLSFTASFPSISHHPRSRSINNKQNIFPSLSVLGLLFPFCVDPLLLFIHPWDIWGLRINEEEKEKSLKEKVIHMRQMCIYSSRGILWIITFHLPSWWINAIAQEGLIKSLRIRDHE